MAQGLKPSDNPVKVREFETRLLLVVFPVIIFYFIFILFYFIFFIYLPGSWCPLFIYFIYLFIFVATHHSHMSVFSFLFSTWDADEASGRGGGVRWCTA